MEKMSCNYDADEANDTPPEPVALKLVDNAAQNPARVQGRMSVLRQVGEIYQEIGATHPYRIKDLALNGQDIMRINHTRRGKEVWLKDKAAGLALDQTPSYVLRHPEQNKPEDLTEFLRANLESIRNEAAVRKEQK